MMMKEKAIRDQIAEKFTLEMKTVEMNCARRIKEIESEQSDANTKLKELLERKAQEVETLKEFVIAERNKVTQILESKENEISVLIKEHNELQADCQKAKDLLLEWKVKAEKYKERATRLGSLEDVLKSEREDWKQKNSSCAREYQAMKVKVSEMQTKLAQMEEFHEKLQMDYQVMQDKYRHAKKTIMTYKVRKTICIKHEQIIANYVSIFNLRVVVDVVMESSNTYCDWLTFRHFVFVVSLISQLYYVFKRFI